MEDPNRDLRTTCLVVLCVLAVIGALYVGAAFLGPIAIAIVLNALFRPVVRGLKRLGVPVSLAAAIVVLGLIAGVTAIGYGLAAPVRNWISDVPQRFTAAEAKIRRIRAPVQKLSDAANQVERAASGAAAGGSTTAPTTQASVSVESPAPGAPPISMTTRVLGTTTALIGGAAEVLLLLYLLLAADRLFLHKLMRVLDSRRDQRVADEVVHEAESIALRYVLVTAMINLGQAIVITLIMWWLGMPTPMLWGLFTFVLEFVPYLGALVMIILLSGTAIATFDQIGHILLVPACYLIVTTLQNNLVSPYLYGQRLKLNPVAVLVSVIFWWYVWGIPGAFLAVPMMAMLKALTDRSERWRGVAEFLAE